MGKTGAVFGRASTDPVLTVSGVFGAKLARAYGEWGRNHAANGGECTGRVRATLDAFDRSVSARREDRKPICAQTFANVFPRLLRAPDSSSGSRSIWSHYTYNVPASLWRYAVPTRELTLPWCRQA